MANSIIALHRQRIIEAIEQAAGDEWKILILDEGTDKLVNCTVEKADILNKNIASLVYVEEKRPSNPDLDAIYLLSPESYVIECLIADILQRRNRSASLLFTSVLPPPLRQRLYSTPGAKEYIVDYRVLPIDYYPRESHLITFRDPWSFPIFYHPACDVLVRPHMETVARKIVAACVTLGEYPVIRYYHPLNSTHEANVLCIHLAKMVQKELDLYAQYNQDFPPKTDRPRGALYILDRSLDPISPLIHEFTYQAMAHDLLPIKDGGTKTTYTAKISEGSGAEIQKEMEISEDDKVWVANRHRHMKDTIEGLMNQFQAFLAQNPHFTDEDGQSSLNAIRAMLAGLPQFQSSKEAYSLNLTMAQDCMSFFEAHRLAELGTVEQTLATGLDEDQRKPRMVADQMIRLLDDPAVTSSDRLRLIILYIFYRDGLITSDIQKLLHHSGLPPQDGEVISNLERLGAHIQKSIGETRAPSSHVFPSSPTSPKDQPQEYTLSRFQPVLKTLLESQDQNTIPQASFPYVKPQLLPSDGSPLFGQPQAASTLRSARPTWGQYAVTPNALPRQRVMIFMAGGATFSESRACYEITRTTKTREVYLLSSHMLTPRLFLRQVGDLSQEKRRLDIPLERLSRKPPAWVFEKPVEPPPRVRTPPMVNEAGSKVHISPTVASIATLGVNGSSHPPSTSMTSAETSKSRHDHRLDIEGDKKKKKHRFWKNL